MLRAIRITPWRRAPFTVSSRLQVRSMATHGTPSGQSPSSLTAQKAAKEWKALSTPQKVAAASKATVNLSVILAGVAVTSALIYFVGSELLGSQSSTSIFSDALERARRNETLRDMLGEPIKGHGAPSRNRMKRNRRITHQIVNDAQGEPHLFMRFYLEGAHNEGTGMLEMIKGADGKWQYKKLFVDVPGQGLPSQRIHLDQD